MENIIKYLINSITPKDYSEFYYSKDFDINIFDLMVQDGIMITENIPTAKENIEYVKIDKYFLIRKCFRELYWYYEDRIKFENNSEPIYRRLLPPPAETIDHSFLIYNLISECNPSEKNYVEYGIRDGKTILLISNIVKKSFGIDLNNCENKLTNNCTFYKNSTNDFSLYILPQINFHFAFIDANPKYENTIDNFKYLYKFIQPNGLIFIHNTYPIDKTFLNKSACDDCYKTPIGIKKNFKNIEIFTFPINPGLTVVRKK
jgi:hypothetical protein